MAERPFVTITVDSFEGLVDGLHSLALKYPDSFDGGVVMEMDTAHIRVAVKEDGETQRFFFKHSSVEPRALRNLAMRLLDSPLVENSRILPHRIVLLAEKAAREQAEREERQQEEQRKEQESHRRWRVHMRRMVLGPVLGAAVGAVFGFAFSYWNYTPKIERLQEEVAALRKQIGAASQPTSRP